jgi:hypothetical protein
VKCTEANHFKNKQGGKNIIKPVNCPAKEICSAIDEKVREDNKAKFYTSPRKDGKKRTRKNNSTIPVGVLPR